MSRARFTILAALGAPLLLQARYPVPPIIEDIIVIALGVVLVPPVLAASVGYAFFVVGREEIQRRIA